ncbi:MAG: hypothetical protein V1676_00300 [Candidatus Diapherotrites archaeon]
MVWMNEKEKITKLHSAARKYCFDGLERLRVKGKPGDDGASLLRDMLSDMLKNLFCAILFQIEKFDPDEFGKPGLNSLEVARAKFIEAGKKAQFASNSLIAEGVLKRLDNYVCDAKDTPIAKASNEIMSFCDYVANISENDLACVEDVPYRHVLPEAIADKQFMRMVKKWDMTIEKYHPEYSELFWWPLAETKCRDLIALNSAPFEKRGLAGIRDILRKHGVKRVLVLNYGDYSYEADLSIFDPRAQYYPQWRVFCTSEKMDWVIYLSHESSITFGGKWLVAKVKKAYPEWKSLVYSRLFENVD